MNLNKLAKIDLNLLVTLQVLLEEESATRAANRLNLSPSALSKSLNRLRETLEDPLFLRTAHGLKPTAHALYLKETLPSILQNLSQLIQPPQFIAEQSDRAFSFAVIGSAHAAFPPSYIGKLLAQAPNIKLNLFEWGRESMQDLIQGRIDFAITAKDLSNKDDIKSISLPNEIEQTLLFPDKQSCLVRSNHPILESVKEGNWNLSAYLTLSHIQIRCEDSDWWALDYHLADLGKQRNIRCTLSDFYSASNLCENSDLLMTLPSSFIPHAQKLHNVVEIPLPFDFIGLVYLLIWHKRNNQEPGHQWIRGEIYKSLKLQNSPNPND